MDYTQAAMAAMKDLGVEPEDDMGPAGDVRQAKQGFDLEAFIEQRRAAQDNGDYQGSEVGMDSETLQMLIDQLDGEGVNNMPAADIMRALMRGEPSPEEANFYDSLDPQARMELLERIVNSDGLGNISSFMDETGQMVPRRPPQPRAGPYGQNRNMADYNYGLSGYMHRGGNTKAPDGSFRQ
jgi:hypothetical protein